MMGEPLRWWDDLCDARTRSIIPAKAAPLECCWPSVLSTPAGRGALDNA
jgi:hypothetical protein